MQWQESKRFMHFNDKRRHHVWQIILLDVYIIYEFCIVVHSCVFRIFLTHSRTQFYIMSHRHTQFISMPMHHYFTLANIYFSLHRIHYLWFFFFCVHSQHTHSPTRFTRPSVQWDKNGFADYKSLKIKKMSIDNWKLTVIGNDISEPIPKCKMSYRRDKQQMRKYKILSLEIHLNFD